MRGIKNANEETNRKLLPVFTQLMIVERELVVKMVSLGKGLDVRAGKCFFSPVVVHFTEIKQH